VKEGESVYWDSQGKQGGITWCVCQKNVW